MRKKPAYMLSIDIKEKFVQFHKSVSLTFKSRNLLMKNSVWNCCWTTKHFIKRDSWLNVKRSDSEFSVASHLLAITEELAIVLNKEPATLAYRKGLHNIVHTHHARTHFAIFRDKRAFPPCPTHLLSKIKIKLRRAESGLKKKLRSRILCCFANRTQ